MLFVSSSINLKPDASNPVLHTSVFLQHFLLCTLEHFNSGCTSRDAMLCRIEYRVLLYVLLYVYRLCCFRVKQGDLVFQGTSCVRLIMHTLKGQVKRFAARWLIL